MGMVEISRDHGRWPLEPLEPLEPLVHVQVEICGRGTLDQADSLPSFPKFAPASPAARLNLKQKPPEAND